MSQKTNLSVIISSLEIFSRVILIPWTFHHLQLALHLSMNRAISINGLLWSCFMGGRVLGRNIFFGYPGVMTPKLSYLTCSIFTISFLFLSISTRTSVICVCYGLIGFSGGIIRTCYYQNEDIQTHSRLQVVGTVASSSSSISLHQEALALIFVPLLAGLTYNSAVTSRFPALILCIATAFLSSLVFLIQCLLQRKRFWNNKKSISSASSSVTGSKGIIRRQTPRKDIPDIDRLDPPQEFLDLCYGNRETAQKKFHKTLMWKAENAVDEIVDIPQDFFDEIMTYYPHGIQGRSRSGGVVCYEQIGRGSTGELKKRGITPDHILRHFMLRNEFILQRCRRNFRDGDLNATLESKLALDSQNDPLCTRLMTVLDVKGIKFSDFSADVIRFIQLSADVMDNHYPGCVERLVICNTPSWFFSIWSVVARVLPESIKKKIVTIDDVSKLDEFIDPKMRPPEYGGTGTPLRESLDHKALVAAAEKWKELGTESQPSAENRTASSLPKGVTSQPQPTTPGKWSWFGGSKDKAASTEAFLGDTNKFYYDASTGRWILEDDPDETNSKREEESKSTNQSAQERHKGKNSHQSKNSGMTLKQSPKRGQGTMTIDQIEEHGLVLAIQAAHHASRLQQGNISSYSSSSAGMSFNSSRDGDREEAGLPAHNTFTSNQLGTPRERKSGPKFLSRSRSLPSEREDTGDSSLDNEDGYVHVEEKPSAELFLVVLGMHMMSCLLLGTIIVALPIWMTMPYRGGGLGYSVKDCAVVMSCAGVMILLTQINSESRIKIALRAFPVRTFRVGVGSLAFFSFLLTQFGRINRLQFTGFSGNNTSLQIPSPEDSSSSSSLGGTLLWFIHILFGIEHFTLPSAENDGTVVSGSYWIPTPAANPLTMVIPGILIGSVLCCAYLTRKSAANLLHISLNSVISSPSKVQHCLSAAASVLAPSTSCLLLRWSHRLHLSHPLNDSFFLTLVACAALLLYIFSLMLTVRFRGEFGVLADDASVSLYETDSFNQSESKKRNEKNNQTSYSSSSSSSSLGLTEILSVPFEDVRHLRALFPGGKKNKDTSVLSARLFSLKLDLKDA